MARKEFMTYLIEWELPQAAFRHQVRDMIHKAEKSGKVLALPMKVASGMVAMDLITMLLAQVNCEGCDAPCCKRNPNDQPIRLLPPEYRRLAEKYGEHHFIKQGDFGIMPMPCPFLKNNRCTIYADRPLVCVLYPFQPGATDGSGNMMLALASSCPEGRRITRQIYMSSWQIRRQFGLLGEENFLEGILEGGQ